MKRRKLVLLRTSNGLNQEEFGKTVGYKGQYISMVETGRTKGGYKFWHKLKTVYNIPESELESYRELEISSNC